MISKTEDTPQKYDFDFVSLAEEKLKAATTSQNTSHNTSQVVNLQISNFVYKNNSQLPSMVEIAEKKAKKQNLKVTFGTHGDKINQSQTLDTSILNLEIEKRRKKLKKPIFVFKKKKEKSRNQVQVKKNRVSTSQDFQILYSYSGLKKPVRTKQSYFSPRNKPKRNSKNQFFLGFFQKQKSPKFKFASPRESYRAITGRNSIKTNPFSNYSASVTI